MNKRFTLEKLTVSGGGHLNSIIEFQDGFNLIIGPSNTGKSLIMDCIDYAFGFTPRVDKPSKIVDNNNGYTHVELTLKTAGGRVTLDREIGNTKIHVTSSDSLVDSGIYSSNHKAKKNISSVLLKLIGIDETHNILSSQKGATQQLTWRSILHLFLMKQTDIDRETSPLLAPGGMGSTASSAALLYLLTTKDANELKKTEDPKISEAKRNAVIMYIRDKRNQLLAKREKLEHQLAYQDIPDIQRLIDTLTAKIDSLQKELDTAVAKSKKLMSEIYTQNGKLSECNTVLYNFTSLSKQYQSDIKRLGFIVDGQIALSNHPKTMHCPFCDSTLKSEPPIDYIAAASVELSKLKSHISELNEAQNSANKQKRKIEEKILSLEVEKTELDHLIESDLQPKINAFRQELRNYIQILNWKNELDFIRQDEQQYNADLFEHEMIEETSEVKYDVKSSYDYQIIKDFEKELIQALEASNIGGASSARLNMQSFDIEIDNRSKPTCMGGGYCAILNTLTVYAMDTCIYENNGFAPGFFAIDSALTQLSEAEYVEKEDSVKSHFMNYLLSRAFDRQVIIIEQKDELPFIPNEDASKGVHVIEFTRNPKEGRYGFLNDVVNPEHK